MMKKILTLFIAFIGLCVSCESGKTASSVNQNDTDTVVVDTVQIDSLVTDTL